MRHCRAGLVVVLVLFLGAVETRAQAPKKYALLVAVAKYEHAGMNKPQLQFPEADARELGKVLEASGYNVELLLGEKATQEAIRTKLAGLRRQGNADGVVVVGFFGHGVEYEAVGADNQRIGEACFCPFDTTLREVTDSQKRKLFGQDGKPLVEPDPASLVTMAELLGALRLSPAGNRVLLADCCRNTPNRARGRAFGAALKLADLPENTAALFACSAQEQAFEHQDWQHGAFTKCLLEELTSLSAGGQVTMGTLADRLQPKVQQLVAAVSEGRDRQTTRSLVTDRVDLQLKSMVISLAGTKAGELREFSDLKIKFRWCPAGTFKMGSLASDTEAYEDEKPQVDVTLSRGFWLGQTELTQGQWTGLMETTPWQGETFVKEGANYAATYVSWEDAQAYCEKLTERERRAGRLPGSWSYRLPTEAEWEYACRAGSRTRYSFGDDASRLGEYAWFDRNTNDVNEKYAHGVGLKKANAWGLCDLHGNVGEWCGDVYQDKLPGGRDPFVDVGASGRVYRGGGWSGSAGICRSAVRDWIVLSDRSRYLGFRLALSPSGE